MIFNHYDIVEKIIDYLNEDHVIQFIQASKLIAKYVSSSKKLLRRINLNVTSENQFDLSINNHLDLVPFKNICIINDSFSNKQRTMMVVEKFKNSIENFEVRNLKARNFEDLFNMMISVKNIKSINLVNCDLESFGEVTLPAIPSLDSIILNKCRNSVLKFFSNQTNIKAISVINENFMFNGFDHESFNKIMKNCPSCQEVTFIGSGTGSYFDRDEFDFQIRKLDTTMITFHWYVGIRNERTDFLKSQQGHLKDLTIHQLPNDFDGGRVLKFILEKMNLNNFHLGKTALILKREKQKVLEFEASEIQVSSLFEMFRQFPTIKRLKLTLNQSEVAIDEIERLINPFTNIFDSLESFEMHDLSLYFDLFGLSCNFMGLLKNLRYIKKLSIKTRDNRLNVILKETLPILKKLEELNLAEVQNALDIVKTVTMCSPRLKKLFINKNCVDLSEECNNYILTAGP